MMKAVSRVATASWDAARAAHGVVPAVSAAQAPRVSTCNNLVHKSMQILWRAACPVALCTGECPAYH